MKLTNNIEELMQSCKDNNIIKLDRASTTLESDSVNGYFIHFDINART